MAMTQDNRDLAITTPLGKDVLLLRRMQGREELGRLSEFELDLLSEQGDVDGNDLLGKAVTVRVNLQDGSPRYFHGMITAFALVAVKGRLSLYRASMRPALWFSTLSFNCRIFNKMSTVDVIKKVLHDYTDIDIQDKLTGSYPTVEYTVQYRESDFDFVSRLMEREGIYYYFTHEQSKHSMVLADAIGAHSDLPDALPYRPGTSSLIEGFEHVSHWQVTQRAVTGKYSLNDMNFEKFVSTSQQGILQRKESMASYPYGKQEIYDYPGAYIVGSEGERYTQLRLDGLQAQGKVVHGRSNARSMASGWLMTLKEHENTSANADYLLVSMNYDLQENAYETEKDAPIAPTFLCHFEAISRQQVFRPLQITPRALVRGLQTATVVGKAGEEIWTDEYGRIMVQFHWDLLGQRDENTSCWIRVAHNWAGKRWGSFFLPRIGQEVVVDFLEGDPDHPLVVGSVYNSDFMPPYALPDNQTRSTIKSNSSKGGGGYNELRLEDKKGSEQVYLHAEKDQDNYVKHDSREYVGNDRSLDVKNDRKELVEGKQSLEVKGDRKEKVGGKYGLEVTGDMSEKVSGNRGMDVSQKIQVKSGMDIGVQAGQQIHLKAGMDLVIEAGMSITLKAGGAFIVVGPAGVDISGMPINLNSGGSAGSGNGSSPGSPDAPDAPDKADDGTS